jgi:tetratricopeptide (TPR) repeat protein
LSGQLLLAWIAIAVLVCVAGVAGAALEEMSGGRSSSEELLYLPNGKYLKVASLGQAPVLADAIYIWAIQYYSNYDRADRYRYVEHVFGDVIAELDPHYIDPYWMGALIMTIEARDLRAALRLLDKGFTNNPDQWVLPYLAAWESYRAGEYERAATYFAQAAGVPDAPVAVRRMHAGMISRAGHLRQALQLWAEVLEDPESDAASRAIAKRQVRHLKVRVDLQELQVAVERFRSETSRYPERLEELLAGPYIESLPRDPWDREYEYDPRTGRVSSVAARVLGDS